MISEGSAKKKGRTVAVTIEDMQKRRNDVKARTTLLLALPDEYQLRFNKYKTAQELWAAILKTFGGNEATRKTKKNLLKQKYGNFKAEGKETLEQTFNRLQAIVSHLEFMDVEIEQDDLNQKLLTSLDPEWLTHTILWRNRSDLDTMSLDDLYNHLKVYEPEVQKKLDSHNMAFISSAKNSNGNGEWNMALLSMRADRYWKKTRKKICIQGTDVVGFDKSKVECFNYHKLGHFARECRAPRSQDRSRRENFKQGSKVEESAPKALMAIDRAGWDWSYMANEEEDHALVADQEAPIEFVLMAKSSSDTEVFDNSLCSKACKKNTDSLNTKITDLSEKLSDNNTITDNSRPSPNIESKSNDLQKNSSSVSKNGESTSSILSKPEINFVKAADSPTVIKTRKDESVWKPSVKYAEMAIPRTLLMTKVIRTVVALECIVLGRDFKLRDDTDVLLRTPRQHNIYSIDLNNIVLHKDLTCLVAKASADESDSRGVEADLGNMEDNISASATLTFRIHKDHPKMVSAGTTSTNFSCTKEAASQDVKKDVYSLRYIALPNWFHEAHLKTSTSNAQDACQADAPESSGNSNPTSTLTNPSADQMEILIVETLIPTVSSPVPTACLDDSPQLSIKRIFRYLKGHPKLGIWYPIDSPFDLVAYSDSDYGGATQDRKSTTKGCQFLGRRLISWQCKKQTIVSTSTTEAEYVAAASGYGQ
nr:putative ribonuclease H-like domain-containing protein [Tanacetum cinerariifolium]